MDEKDSSVSNDSSVSVESELLDTRGSYHTPLDSPPQSVKDDRFFHTPLDSPEVELFVKEEQYEMPMSQIRLTVPSPSSSTVSSESVQEAKEPVLLVPPTLSSRSSSSCSKLVLSESPCSSTAISDGEESKSSKPSYATYEELKASPIKIQFSPRKIVSSKYEPFHLPQPHTFYPAPKKLEEETICDVSFNISEEPYQETEHVLKKYTKSPEFLQLKDSLKEAEVEDKVNKTQELPSLFQSCPVQSTFFKDIINKPKTESCPRKSSLVYVSPRNDGFNYRKSSLDNINILSLSKAPEIFLKNVQPSKEYIAEHNSVQDTNSSINSSLVLTPLIPLKELYKDYKCPIKQGDLSVELSQPLENSLCEHHKKDLMENFLLLSPYADGIESKLVDAVREEPVEKRKDNDETSFIEVMSTIQELPVDKKKNKIDDTSLINMIISNLEPHTEERKGEEDDVNFINMIIAKPESEKTEEKTCSSKNLQIFEPLPNADCSLSEENTQSYDLPKLKKPSSRLVDLLEYCKKNSKGKSNATNSYKSIPYQNLSHGEKSLSNSVKDLIQETNKTTELIPEERQPLLYNFDSLTSRDRRKNFKCCIQQSKDSELFVQHSEDNDGDDLEVSCGQSMKKMFLSESGKRKSKGKNKDKEGSRRRTKQAKSISLENNKTSQKSHRLDQSYCDLLKQLHDEMQKQRPKLPKKQTERVCRSDPPIKTVSAYTSSQAKLFESYCENISRLEEFYDFNVKSIGNNPTGAQYQEFDREPYSKRPLPKEKVKLERMESFYDNKRPNDIKLERIESLYENNQSKSTKSEESCDSEMINFNVEVIDTPCFPECKSDKERVSPPKSLMTFLPSEWWPVVETPKTNLAWNWRPPSEVRFVLSLR